MRRSVFFGVVAQFVGLGLFGVGCSAARMGASAITQPWRIPVVGSPSSVHQELSVRTEDGLLLQGWLFPVDAPRGLVVLLHGKDINRQHFVVRAEHLQQLGYAVLAYDQRAHGRSEGKYLTYGAKEVPDLSRYLDAALAGHPDVLLHDEAWVVIEDFVTSSLSPNGGEGQGEGPSAVLTPPAS